MKRIFTFAFVFLLFFSGCAKDNIATFSEESVVLDKKTSINKIMGDAITETAKELLENDYKVAKLFAGGMLTELVDVSNREPTELLPAAGTEYEDFFVIEKLLISTYSVSSGVIEKYLNYPEYGTRAITSDEGKTMFSFHYIEEIQKINIDSVTVSDGENSNQKIINADDITIPMGFNGKEWLLEDSVFFIQREEVVFQECDFAIEGMNTGSAATLTGNVLIVEVFLIDKNDSFTQEEMDSYSAKISESIDYIKKEAAEYGGLLNIEVNKLFFKYNTKIDLSPESYDFDLALARTEYQHLDRYISDNFDTSKYDNYLAIICAYENGKGYARPFNDADTDVFNADRCVMFSGDDTIMLTRNILTLFGAYLQTDSGLLKLMENYFEDDIMLCDDLDRAYIGELTAYQVGLTKYLDKQFHAFYNIEDKAKKTD